jgi:hypothetical protein
MTLFLLMPFSKMVHGFFRLTALIATGGGDTHADHLDDLCPLHRRPADRRLGRATRTRPIPRDPHLPALGLDRGRCAIRHPQLLTHLLVPCVLARTAATLRSPHPPTHATDCLFRKTVMV